MAQKRKFFITKEELEYEYIVLDLTYKQIASKFGTCETCVFNTMKKYNIPSKNRKLLMSKKCMEAGFHSRFKGYGEISGHHICCIKGNAKRTNKIFNLSPKFLWELYLKQNKKCALSGLEIGFPPINVKIDRKIFNTASLDRIDSSEGYVEGNVQWVHKHINKMKTNFENQYYIDMCIKVANNCRKQE